MNLARRTWALSALALTLVLGACSTPDDLAAPTLEPQFGTSDNDFGIDVAYPASGRAYVLSEQGGYYNDGYDDGNVNTAVLSRYDGNGNLVWSNEVASSRCSYEEDCVSDSLTTRVLGADGRGYLYTLVSYNYIFNDSQYGFAFYVDKTDASGNSVKSFYAGETGYSFDGERAGVENAVDMAVDSSGNVYVVRVQYDYDYSDESSSYTNVVAKYSTTGTLMWQRTSSVGIPYGIALSSSGFVYVAGSTGVAKYSSSGDLRWTKPGAATDIAVSGTSNVYARYRTTVRKLNADGKQLWSKVQSGLSGMVVADMTTDANANLYLTGKYSASGRSRDVFTRKLNSSGSTLFTKTFGTTAYDDATGIATLNGSEIYLAGSTQGALVPSHRGGGYVRKLSSSGNPVWTR